MAATVGVDSERWCIVLVVVERDGSPVRGCGAHASRRAVPAMWRVDAPAAKLPPHCNEASSDGHGLPIGRDHHNRPTPPTTLPRPPPGLR